jgi:glycosyltransferase involved in cell wall biosynthesis
VGALSERRRRPVRRVHLVYRHGPGLAYPDAIGRHLAHGLSGRYEVVLHDWDTRETIAPEEGDALVGHPHPFPGTTFRRSAARPGWERVIDLAPYHHGDEEQVAFHEHVLPRCDLFLAITGGFWFRRVGESAFAHWLPKMVHVDLALDRGEFPPLEREFAPPGARRFVFVGRSDWTKNVDYLAAIAAGAPELELGWIGDGPPIAGVSALGRRDLSTAESRQLLAGFDFMLTVGRADANPATILEAMAWGLVPVCTPQSGYSGEPGVVNVPLDDIAGAVAVLRGLQAAPAGRLEQLRAANHEALDRHFNWTRFTGQVVEAIESVASPTLGRPSWPRRLRLRTAELRSPYSPLRYRNVREAVRGTLARR